MKHAAVPYIYNKKLLVETSRKKTVLQHLPTEHTTVHDIINTLASLDAVKFGPKFGTTAVAVANKAPA